jgi:hypothetical protein
VSSESLLFLLVCWIRERWSGDSARYKREVFGFEQSTVVGNKMTLAVRGTWIGIYALLLLILFDVVSLLQVQIRSVVPRLVADVRLFSDPAQFAYHPSVSKTQ